MRVQVPPVMPTQMTAASQRHSQPLVRVRSERSLKKVVQVTSAPCDVEPHVQRDTWTDIPSSPPLCVSSFTLAFL